MKQPLWLVACLALGLSHVRCADDSAVDTQHIDTSYDRATDELSDAGPHGPSEWREDDAPSSIAGAHDRLEVVPNGNRYVLSCPEDRLAEVIEALVQHGDDVVDIVSDAGFAVIETDDPDAARRSGCDVVQDVLLYWLQGDAEASRFATAALPELAGRPSQEAGFDMDSFQELQWGLVAVQAPTAWEAGHRGAGARVAILDTGFDLTHPDLRANINLELSRDFTGEGLAWTDTSIFSHGTHVAGIVAASANGVGTVGVAPEAELVLLKVLRDTGYGSFAAILRALYYAAAIDVDVINLSLAGYLSEGRHDALIDAMERATQYARRRGVVVIAATGNDYRDLDALEGYVVMPAQAPSVLGVSATGPYGWATREGVSVDQFASYSNRGYSVVDLAAPGGGFTYPRAETCSVALSTRSHPIVAPCYVFDYVASTGAYGGYYWSAGTSMAAPHVAGVAALIISERPGATNPTFVEAQLRRRAEDLGPPRQDPYFGNGRASSGHATHEAPHAGSPM